MLLFAAATVLVAMITPLIHEALWVAALPDPLEWYLRPTLGHTSFVLFPWAAYLFAGAIVGEAVDATRNRSGDGALQLILLGCGVLVIVGGYLASLQPAIYRAANFWINSPTFVFIRLGIALALAPVTWLLEKTVPPLRFLETFGRSSLFVYWIHVEMVYGVIAKPLSRLLPLPLSLLGVILLCALRLAIVRWKNRVVQRIELIGPFRILSPVLR